LRAILTALPLARPVGDPKTSKLQAASFSLTVTVLRTAALVLLPCHIHHGADAVPLVWFRKCRQLGWHIALTVLVSTTLPLASLAVKV